MISPEQKKTVIKKISAKKWERWLQRPFGAFILSLFAVGAQKKYFLNIGAKNVELKFMVFVKGDWYTSDEIIQLAKALKPYAKTHGIFGLSASLNRFLLSSRQKIARLNTSKLPLEDKLAEVKMILAQATTYLWMSHGLDVLYEARWRREAPKYVKGNVAKFIGDASLPTKKNAYNLMEDMIRRGAGPESVAEKYGWVRCRNLSADPFSVKDIKQMKKQMKPVSSHSYPAIPLPLKGLIRELRELIWYRTARGDVLYELLYLCRPIIFAAAKQYRLDQKDMEYYTIDSLLDGKPRRYSKNFTFLYYRGLSIYSNKPLIKFKESKKNEEVRGQVAFAGRISGRVKVVTNVIQISKVRPGDILVTQMTFPNFLPAMQRAAAFVTDEGGITCHAAIVAREMKKPCVIATKIATQVFKDGDLIEVDAEKGIVRKINK